MSPPSFGDLGKRAGDIIANGFRHGFIDFELKTASASGIRVNSSGAASLASGDSEDTGNGAHNESGAITAETEVKFDLEEYGLSFKDKWVSAKSPKYSEDTLKSDIAYENPSVLPGTKFTFESSFAPASGKRKEKVKATFKRDFCHFNSDLSFPALKGNAALTLGFKGFVFGYRSPLSRNPSVGDFAIGFSSKDVEVSTKILEKGERLSASMCHRVNEKITTAFVTSWNCVTNDTTLSLGAEFKPDRDATMKVKVDHLSRLGLAYTQNLTHGLSLSASALIDGRNVEGGNHEVGFGLNFDLS